MNKSPLPVHDLSYERIILATVLNYPEIINELASILRPEHMFDDAHRAIYESSLALHEAGHPVDITTVAAWLRDHEKLAKVGGVKYLVELNEGVAVTVRFAHHAHVIKNLWRQRKLQELNHRSAAELYEAIEDVGEYAATLGAKVHDIATDSTKARGRTARQILVDTFEEWSNPAKVYRIDTGHPDLDRVLQGLRGKQLITIGAHSGVGKSALAACIIANNVKKRIDGLPVGQVVFSLEMSEKEWMQRLVFSNARVDTWKLGDGKTDLIQRDEWDRISDETTGFAVDHLRIIDDLYDMASIRAECLRVRAEFQRAKHPLRHVVIDYAQLAKAGREDRKRTDNREQEVAAVSRAAKGLAKELDVPVTLLAQLNEDAKKDKRRVRGADLRESRALLHDSDKVILIDNPNADARAEVQRNMKDGGDGPLPPEDVFLIVAKNRGGRIGTVKALYWPSFTLFGALERNW